MNPEGAARIAEAMQWLGLLLTWLVMLCAGGFIIWAVLRLRR